MFIDDLIAFGETRSPGFKGKIDDLPIEAYEAFEAYFGRPLPRMYRDFQLAMGMSTGPLVFKDRTFEMNELSYHRAFARQYPRRYVMLALDTPPPEYASALSWFYDLDRCGPNDGPVVAFDDRMGFSPERVMPIADTFQELLCTHAFAALSLDPCAHRLRLYFAEDPGPNRPRFQRAAALLEAHDFVAPLPVSRNYWGGEHADGTTARIHCLPDRDSSFSLDLASDDRAATRAIWALLERELGPAGPPLPGDDHSR